MLELAAYELSNIVIVKPETLPMLDTNVFHSADWMC